MLSKSLKVHPLADEEAAEAYRYYKRRNVDAVLRFKRELARCLASIESRPLTFQRHLSSTRRCCNEDISVSGDLSRPANGLVCGGRVAFEAQTGLLEAATKVILI